MSCLRPSSGNLKELAEGRLGLLLVRYSWPALVAMSLNALYAVVDRFYIGQGCGESVMAALTLAMPVMMLFGAFGVFIGAGHSAVLSIKLGENDFVSCEKLVGELIALKFLFFLVLPPIVLFNLDTVLGWCGGNKVSVEAFEQAKIYLKIVLFSHLFAHLAFGLSALTRAEGGAVKSMMSLVIGFGANLVLDPIFIFGFKMGVSGAAWATNIAMLVSCLWAFAYYFRGKTIVKLRWYRVGLYREFLGRTTAIGFAPFLQQLLGAAINVALASAFARWACDEASATQQIASLGVFQSVMILVFMPILGAQQGLQPIIGYNWGARNFRRVRETLFLGFWVTTALCVVASMVQLVPPFPTWLARLFVSADNTDLLRLAVHDLQLSNCMLWCIGLNVMATTYFMSIGKPMVAVVLSTMRQGVVLMPMVCFLPYFMEDHAFAIWLAMPVSDVICCILTVLPFYLHVRFLSRVRARKCDNCVNIGDC